MTEEFFFLQPLTGQRQPVGQRNLPSPVEKIFTAPPRVALVISTYAAVAYVELALEVRRRLYPDIPVLVHDDAGGQTDALAAVCRKYGADLQVNSACLGHEMGDLSSIVGGLHWATQHGIDLLVKMSRRFIPLMNWVPPLQTLALNAQYGTYSAPCRRWSLPIRSECLAMYTQHWAAAAPDMTRFMLGNLESIPIEHYVYGHARRVHAMACQVALAWERQHNRTTPRPAIAHWDFLVPDRETRTGNYLWHDWAKPQEYAELSRQMGLNYPDAAFEGFCSPAGT